MRLNSKGQVTIPAALRAKHNLREGDAVEDGATLRIVRAQRGGPSCGRRLASDMRGRATTSRGTDELMELLRGE